LKVPNLNFLTSVCQQVVFGSSAGHIHSLISFS